MVFIWWFQKGDVIQIRVVGCSQAVAIGVMLISGKELVTNQKGKAVQVRVAGQTYSPSWHLFSAIFQSFGKKFSLTFKKGNISLVVVYFGSRGLELSFRNFMKCLFWTIAYIGAREAVLVLTLALFTKRKTTNDSSFWYTFNYVTYATGCTNIWGSSVGNGFEDGHWL